MRFKTGSEQNIMNLIHQSVNHRRFGIGTVTAQDDNSLTVEFSSKTCRFIYPDAIVSNILPLEDESVRFALMRSICRIQG
jgi:transcription elongation factor GreA-like protein